MTKSVFKEIIIMMLLCIAILLILGVLFYDYIPSNKIVPNKVAYETPENVSQELAEDINNGTFVNITYQLDDSQLDVSRKNKEYEPGKQNPFESVTTQTQDNTVGANTTSSNGGTQTSGTTSDGSSEQTGTSGQSQTTNGNSADVDSGAYLPTGGAK